MVLTLFASWFMLVRQEGDDDAPMSTPTPKTTPLPPPANRDENREMKRRSIFLEMLIAGAAFCLLLGLSLPVVELSWLFIFSEKHSILSVIGILWRGDEWALAAILFTFSILFPLGKLGFLLFLYARRLNLELPGARLLAALAWLGRWSMLDVLVLALVVFYAKQQQVADATALPGIYIFGACVLLTMWASELAEQQFADLRRARATAPDPDAPSPASGPKLLQDRREAGE